MNVLPRTAGARPGPLKTPRYFNAKVSICGDSPAQVRKLDCMFVDLAGCIGCEGHLPPTFGLHAHYLCFCLRDRKPEQRARSHDHRRHHLQPF